MERYGGSSGSVGIGIEFRWTGLVSHGRGDLLRLYLGLIRLEMVDVAGIMSSTDCSTSYAEHITNGPKSVQF